MLYAFHRECESDILVVVISKKKNDHCDASYYDLADFPRISRDRYFSIFWVLIFLLVQYVYTNIALQFCSHLYINHLWLLWACTFDSWNFSNSKLKHIHDFCFLIHQLTTLILTCHRCSWFKLSPYWHTRKGNCDT